MEEDINYSGRTPDADDEFFNQSASFQGKSLNNLEQVLDATFSEGGGPGYSTALSSILHGIKIVGNGVALAPLADDTIGLVFVPRPLLNLSDENCKGPRFSKFYKANRNSMLNYVRGLLDKEMGKINTHPSLNNLNPWICPLTNLVITSDGFPDLSLEMKTTTPGIRQEVHQIPIGLLDDNGPNSINMSFRNIRGSIMQVIFEHWEHYIPEVRLGDHGMSPRYNALRGHYADWDTRVYHFIVNPNMINIEQCIMTIESVPTTFPQGSLFAINTQEDTKRAQNQDTFDVQFKGVGSRSNTYEVVEAFNETTYFFNEELRPETRDASYRKLTRAELLDYGNYKAIPLINIDTMEFEWYVHRKENRNDPT